jgi:hypothetical protein
MVVVGRRTHYSLVDGCVKAIEWGPKTFVSVSLVAPSSPDVQAAREGQAMTNWMTRNARRVIAMLTGLMLVSCQPPPGMERERELYAGIEKKDIDPLGRLEVFTTSLGTDGRNVKVRGKLRNPMPDAVDGVRIMFKIFRKEPSEEVRPLDIVQEEKALHMVSGGTEALRMDLQTMYAGGAGGYSFFFVVEAYAKRVGERDIPPPPGWKE